MPPLLVLLQIPLQLDNPKKILDGFYAYYPLNRKHKYHISSIASCIENKNYDTVYGITLAAIVSAILVLVALFTSFLLYIQSASALLRRIELLEEAGLQYDRKG